MIALGCGALIALVVAVRTTGAKIRTPVEEGGRLLQAIGWALILPQMEALFGALPRAPGSQAHWEGSPLFQANDPVSSLESPGGRRLIATTSTGCRVALVAAAAAAFSGRVHPAETMTVASSAPATPRYSKEDMSPKLSAPGPGVAIAKRAGRENS